MQGPGSVVMLYSNVRCGGNILEDYHESVYRQRISWCEGEVCLRDYHDEGKNSVVHGKRKKQSERYTMRRESMGSFQGTNV